MGPPAFSFEGNENTKRQGSQTFEFIVTPLEAGLIEIPPVSFTYFNPEQEKYYALNTNAHSLRKLTLERSGLYQNQTAICPQQNLR